MTAEFPPKATSRATCLRPVELREAIGTAVTANRSSATSCARRSPSSSRARRRRSSCAEHIDPRAPSRPLARRHPQGLVRHEPPLARADRPRARPARGAPRDRRRHRRRAPRRRPDAGSRSRARYPTPRSRASSTTRAPAARSHAAIPFDLKRTMSVSRGAALQLAGDDLLQLVHLEPVEDAALDRLDQVAGLELRLLARVAADERGALEHRVVELAARRVVGADRADERALAQPLAAEHGVLRRRHRDDDVGVGRLAVRLGRLAAVLAAELGEPLRVPAVDDDALDRRHRRADARDLRGRLPAAADHAEARGALAREVPRRDARGCAGAELPELVGLDHRLEPRRRVEREEQRRRTASRSASRHTTSAPRSRARGRRRPSPRTAPSSSGSRVRGRLSTTPRASRRNDSSTASTASAGESSSATSASRR